MGRALSMLRRSTRDYAPAVVLLLALLFGSDKESFNYAYLLLLPVTWASMRFGLAGAVLRAQAQCEDQRHRHGAAAEPDRRRCHDAG